MIVESKELGYLLIALGWFLEHGYFLNKSPLVAQNVIIYVMVLDVFLLPYVLAIFKALVKLKFDS